MSIEPPAEAPKREPGRKKRTAAYQKSSHPANLLLTGSQIAN
jgi:hypothetical protein